MEPSRSFSFFPPHSPIASATGEKPQKPKTSYKPFSFDEQIKFIREKYPELLPSDSTSDPATCPPAGPPPSKPLGNAAPNAIPTATLDSSKWFSNGFSSSISHAKSPAASAPPPSASIPLNSTNSVPDAISDSSKVPSKPSFAFQTSLMKLTPTVSSSAGALPPLSPTAPRNSEKSPKIPVRSETVQLYAPQEEGTVLSPACQVRCTPTASTPAPVTASPTPNSGPLLQIPVSAKPVDVLVPKDEVSMVTVSSDIPHTALLPTPESLTPSPGPNSELSSQNHVRSSTSDSVVPQVQDLTPSVVGLTPSIAAVGVVAPLTSASTPDSDPLLQIPTSVSLKDAGSTQDKVVTPFASEQIANIPVAVTPGPLTPSAEANSGQFSHIHVRPMSADVVAAQDQISKVSPVSQIQNSVVPPSLVHLTPSPSPQSGPTPDIPVRSDDSKVDITNATPHPPVTSQDDHASEVADDAGPDPQQSWAPSGTVLPQVTATIAVQRLDAVAAVASPSLVQDALSTPAPSVTATLTPSISPNSQIFGEIMMSNTVAHALSTDSNSLIAPAPSDMADNTRVASADAPTPKAASPLATSSVCKPYSAVEHVPHTVAVDLCTPSVVNAADKASNREMAPLPEPLAPLINTCASGNSTTTVADAVIASSGISALVDSGDVKLASPFTDIGQVAHLSRAEPTSEPGRQVQLCAAVPLPSVTTSIETVAAAVTEAAAPGPGEPDATERSAPNPAKAVSETEDTRILGDQEAGNSSGPEERLETSVAGAPLVSGMDSTAPPEATAPKLSNPSGPLPEVAAVDGVPACAPCLVPPPSSSTDLQVAVPVVAAPSASPSEQFEVEVDADTAPVLSGQSNRLSADGPTQVVPALRAQPVEPEGTPDQPACVLETRRETSAMSEEAAVQLPGPAGTPVPASQSGVASAPPVADAVPMKGSPASHVVPDCTMEEVGSVVPVAVVPGASNADQRPHSAALQDTIGGISSVATDSDVTQAHEDEQNIELAVEDPSDSAVTSSQSTDTLGSPSLEDLLERSELEIHRFLQSDSDSPEVVEAPEAPKVLGKRKRVAELPPELLLLLPHPALPAMEPLLEKYKLLRARKSRKLLHPPRKLQKETDDVDSFTAARNAHFLDGESDSASEEEEEEALPLEREAYGPVYY